MFLRLLEFVVVFFLTLTVLTQIIVPIFRGRVMFPMFRKQKKLEDKIAKNMQASLEIELEKLADKTTVRCCGNCAHPVNRTCQNILSPNNGKEVKQFNTCKEHEEGDYECRQ